MINVYKKAYIPLWFLILGGLLTGLSSSVSWGQSCTGVLGGAVVNETFGSDGPYQLRPGQTTYTRLTTCPNDGQYLIAPGLSCNPDEWHPLSEDHTPGDTKGNMLIVNAAEETGEFFNQPVSGLCYGTTYEFSVWVMNLVNTSPTNGCNTLAPVALDPRVVMRVEGVNGQVLQTINTGSVPRTGTATWVRYATVFTLPAGANSVVIKLVNNGPGGCGNDLALDDIQLRPCRPTLRIRFSDATAPTLSLCQGSTAPIRSELGSGYLNPAYQWQVSTDSVSWRAIGGAGNPIYTAGATALGKTYYRLLGAPVSGGSAAWDTACSTVSNTLAVNTVRSGECSPPQFYAPDAFTPNNDGVNDQFRIYVNEGVARLGRFQLRVYNRWGSVIFASDDLTAGWDGTFTAQPCSGDLYAWVIDCQLSYDNQVQRFTREGRVLLIR